MYEAIITLAWAVAEKTKAGTVLPYNKVDGKAIKIISGISPDECSRKVEEFISEGQFIKLDEEVVINGRPTNNKKR